MSENTNNKMSVATIISVIGAVVSVLALILNLKYTQSDLVLSSVSNGFQESANKIEQQANELSEALVNNSNQELEVFRKQVSFNIVQDLYEEFYHFGDSNFEIIKKLDRAAKERQKTGSVSTDNTIQNADNLLLYLNSFESLYDQCKKGLISYEEVRMNFMHLIGATCNNSQVDELTAQGFNGLLLLCSFDHPDSLLGKRANTSMNSCK